MSTNLVKMPENNSNNNRENNADLFLDVELGLNSDDSVSSGSSLNSSQDNLSTCSRDSLPLIQVTTLDLFGQIVYWLKVFRTRFMANKTCFFLSLFFALFGLIILSVVIGFETDDMEHQQFQNSVFVTELRNVLKECYAVLKRKSLNRFVTNLPLSHQLVLRELVLGHCSDIPSQMTFDDAEQCLRRFQ